MKIFGQTSAKEGGFILSGYYSWDPPESLRPKLFELSSQSFGIENFASPYDAILKDAFSIDPYLAVGRRVKKSGESLSSNMSGAFYYYDTPTLIGACHGKGRNSRTFYSGYNFYNAFYPAGYFSPPFGEIPTLTKLNKDEYDNLDQGACFKLNVTEYNEQFGIMSKVAPDADIATDSLTPGTLQQIVSMKESCPDESIVTTPYYFEEIQGKRIPGSASAIMAPTFYNFNPIPTSLDSYDTIVDGRYVYTTVKESNYIQFNSDGRPKINYSSGSAERSKLNNVLCQAQMFETSVGQGRLTNGEQMMDAPDFARGGVGGQSSSLGQYPWNYWHFLFRENTESFPFYNNFKQINADATHRTMSQGTQIFNPVLSSEDYYWQNRQCPDTVDYLPWNFGASIYACPSEHFDIPYYASIKRFGFYGTRFLNSCSRLNLDKTWNGVANALELGPQTTEMEVPNSDTEPEGIDEAGNWSFSSYDNLLKVASAEERHSSMYAFNKGFFLWANSGCITGNSNWAIVSQYPGFTESYFELLNKFQKIYPSGLISFVSGEPKIIIQEGETSTSFSVIDSGIYSDILLTNKTYEYFREKAINTLSGAAIDAWNTLEYNYAYYISDCQGQINSDIYRNMTSGMEKRIRTRYFENVVRGNPIDLFPLNRIMFSSDNAKDYLENTGWSRAPYTFSAGSDLPPIQRRYFEGAYGNASSASGVSSLINTLSFVKDSSFYPGFFNAFGVGKDSPSLKYIPILSGYIRDSAGRRFSPSGWLAAGYNEIGALDSNFSCFTPIFVQQPLDKVFCKVGQRPTLRTLAVDYHTIPEDKMSFRYPEIAYWTSKLKITNSNIQNNYPMQYKWFRVKKEDYSDFELSADFGFAEFSDTTGEWCAFEGDNSPTCTIVHPNECEPKYYSASSLDYTFIKGAKINDDDNYYYMCLAIGRFGVRISEPSELVIENWVRFDVSHKNGMNAPGKIKVNFVVNDKDGIEQTVSFQSDKDSPAYKGYQEDRYAIPEGVIEQKVPPPNAGFGDVLATRFIGAYGFVGATRSYSPDTLKDTRGLRESWGKFLDYGSLISLSKLISQRDGDLLYGYQHLPKCENYAMANGKHGVRVEVFLNNSKVKHWSLSQKAFASIDNIAGMQWNKIYEIGSLYPPANNSLEIDSPNMGVGHWQWGNNLGAIKRFGYLSTTSDNDLVLLGRGVSPSAPIDPVMFKKIKQRFVSPSTLAGENCGYNDSGLGRNMLYYIEAFDRFYLICDPLGKKNVTNKSFICPGLRGNNSAIQYFWLGQPRNTYVERRAMFGPYAYQWRVKRHNRDRNGNGISEGFYSMGHGTKYELMYDAPAIYGLYIKTDATPEYKSAVKKVKELRNQYLGSINPVVLRTIWFGEAGGDGGAKRYGNMMFSCDPTHWAYNEALCNYVSAGKDLAINLDFRAYSCPEERLAKGECFDPCLSLRYGQGFFPGGKAQNLFAYNPISSANLPEQKNLRLVASSNFKNNSLIIKDEKSTIDSTIYFRSPINTPHARVIRGLQKIEGTTLSNKHEIVGVSPCKDGGSDHCNYLTPTIHMDTSSFTTTTNTFIDSQGYAANIYQLYDVRGGD